MQAATEAANPAPAAETRTPPQTNVFNQRILEAPAPTSPVEPGATPTIAMMQPGAIARESPASRPEPIPTQAVPQPQIGKEADPALPRSELRALIDRGQGRIEIGDIALARLLFERAARGGSAQAAFALAETYDPNLIWRLGAIGLKGNPQKARYWYLNAQKLDRRIRIGERLKSLLGQ